MMKLSTQSKKKISRLFQNLSKMTGLSAMFMDVDAKLIASSAQHLVCADFHQAYERSNTQCHENLQKHCRETLLDTDGMLAVCPMGIGYAVKNVYLNQEKVGCVFGGPFFLTAPKRTFFIKQAEEYGYNQEKYLEKIMEISVVDKERALSHLRMIHRLISFAISVEKVKKDQIEEEKELIENNQELEGAYQQLVASEEELRSRYDELKEKEREIIETEDRYKKAVEASQDGVWDWHIPSGNNYISDRYSEMLGYDPRKSERTFQFFKSLVHPEDMKKVEETLEGFLRGDYIQKDYLFRMRAADGAYRWIQTRGKVFEWDREGRPVRIVGTQRDITESRRLEKKLKDSQRRTEMAINASGNGWWDTDLKTKEVTVSDITKNLWGIEQNHLSVEAWQNLIHPEDREKALREEAQKLKAQKSFVQQYRILRPDGSIRWVLDRGRAVAYDEKGNTTRVSGMISDITEKIEKDQRYKRHQEELEALFNYSPDALVYTEFEDGKNIIKMINRHFEEMFGYSEEEACGNDLDRLVVPAKTYHEGLNISKMPLHNEYYEGKVERITKEGVLVPAVLRVGPAIVDGKVVGAQGSYTDISKLLLTEKKLRKTLRDAVDGLSRISEKRDLYTADHQKKVASLAVAIAKQIGWQEHQIEGLRTAALLHDIGKMMIPTDILSKPSRLTNLEFEYIKTHPQNAFEILKNIEFDWPVAKIVLQHHERCDGSGYPQGLEKDCILPEARILIVADVVEAISSHRPYRPALGIEVALEEITNFKGSWYDEEVVEACLFLFRKRSFSF
ncbi:PAS domain S-box-containing protein/HDIG domain-containing protein [Tindallia californiensis]|uniref:PAS domain S-box-containing protein/HDIG domain-containing protein n=2 Tax=Tindallia californiensis TaxID=159292 RepID=A0A1H3L6K4_9FIRM|nr:PAS domain S-box-containing protein/HDIG domain-containing protein [Tindallia californiensis]